MIKLPGPERPTTMTTIFAPAERRSYSAGMERYVIRGGRQGYERLRVLARTWLPTTSALLDRVQLGAGMRCLDLGCGGGDVTFELARRVGPGGWVVGIDMDEVKIGLARQAAVAQGLPAVEFRVMNVYGWAEPNAYDLVYCRNLLQHLSRPVEVLGTMWEAVPAFLHCGYSRSRAECGPAADVVSEAKTLPYSTVQATAESIIEEGIASADQVHAALESLNDFAADPASVCGSPRLFQAWSRRGQE